MGTIPIEVRVHISKARTVIHTVTPTCFGIPEIGYKIVTSIISYYMFRL
jgi:hypothetical protein